MAASRLVFFWILIVLRTAAGFLQEEEEDLNETVLCSNNLMKVVIPSIFFLRKDPPVFVGDLHLNDPECRGVEVGEDYVFSIKTNLSDCGTLTVSDQSHIMFTNSIHNNESQVITRNYVNITFSCRYPVRYLVQQPGGGSRGARAPQDHHSEHGGRELLRLDASVQRRGVRGPLDDRALPQAGGPRLRQSVHDPCSPDAAYGEMLGDPLQ
ncbi:uncharacterized protein si:dkeyp-110a12.4 [Trematomus bernacchii]|uniref:uncharacterized protein si:dkeyp-110a12.4 n=1 Tax=Trematomus bernacchii TaxID=40690 RepID=UPI00146B756C|nr:uncharacterized protein si:dkeyp-110a12.4 [Trematomus bernacchii]